MTWTEMPYEDFTADGLGDLEEIRRFDNCVARQALAANRYLLILEETSVRVTICEYETVEEWARDIAYLRAVPPDGGASGLPVAPLPVPPAGWARDAWAMPIGDEELG